MYPHRNAELIPFDLGLTYEARCRGMRHASDLITYHEWQERKAEKRDRLVRRAACIFCAVVALGWVGVL